jgi:hypothetical protein
MKKYFFALIFTVTLVGILLVSCKKDVSGPNNASKANSGNISNIGKTRIVTQDESTYVKRYN